MSALTLDGIDEADVLITDTESGSSEEASGSEEEASSWISWFCSLKGNEFFCEVDEDYIQDDFNLSGLSNMVPYYEFALDLILDSEAPSNDCLSEEQHEVVETAAELLYGLIHVRWILTSRGMAAMSEKFKSGEFGTCPRVLCDEQPCLPVGTSDVPRLSRVKLFCPLCQDCYTPRGKHHENIDGAFFGTTFPHLMMMTYPHYMPRCAPEPYVPKAFGFKIHHSALDRPPPDNSPENRVKVMVKRKEYADKRERQANEESVGNGSAMQH